MKPGTKASGFSLIEVLVALAVAMLLVSGTAELIALSLAAVRSGDTASELAQVLAAKLEHLKSCPFDGDDLRPGNYEESVPGGASRHVFEVSWTIEAAGDGLKLVRILAYPKGRPQSGASIALYLCRDLGFAP